MSITAAREFRRHVNRMPTLQREVAAYVQDGFVDYAGLARLGSRSGFDFTEAEARQVLAAVDDEVCGCEAPLVSGIIVPAG